MIRRTQQGKKSKAIVHRRRMPRQRCAGTVSEIGRMGLAVVLAMSIAIPSYATMGIASALDPQAIQATEESSQSPLSSAADPAAPEDVVVPVTDEASSDNEGSAVSTDASDPAPSLSSVEVSDEASSNESPSTNAIEHQGDESKESSAQEKDIEKASEGTLSAQEAVGDAKENSVQTNARAASGSKSLNTLWRNQPGGTARDLTLTEGGTYTLNANLTVGGKLIINAPDQDVTINLGSSVLSGTRIVASSVNDETALLNARRCRKLTIVGSRPFGGIVDDAHKGPLYQLVLPEGNMRHVVDSNVDEVIIRNVGMDVKAHKDYTELYNLDACGVYVNKGDAILDNCAISIDHGLQTESDASARELKGFPKGVYATNYAKSLELSNCFVSIIGSPAAQRSSNRTYSPTSCDNAYGVYCPGNTQAVVRGGSFSVSCPQGSAAAVYANKLNVENLSVPASVLGSYANEESKAAAKKVSTLSLNVEGRDRAFGLVAMSKQGMHLNAPVAFESGKSSFPKYQAALMTKVEEGIVFGTGFNGSNLSVLGGDLADANASGYRFGTYGKGLSSERKQSIASMLTNAVADGSCSIDHDATGLFFSLEQAKAAAVIVAADGTETSYSSVAAALKAQRRGEIVRLCKDQGSLVIDEATTKNEGETGRTLVLDFNGHAIFSLLVDTSEAVRLYSSGSVRGKINGSSLENKSCIAYKGKGDLSVSSIDMTGYLSYEDCAGILVEGNGKVAIEDVTIIVNGQTAVPRGIYQASGDASMTIRNSRITATVQSMGVSAFGIESKRSESSLVLENCTVRASSLNGTTGAVLCKGTLEVSGEPGKSLLSATTQTTATNVYAVGLSDASAEARLVNVDLEATCAKGSGEGAYWCLWSGGASPIYTCSWTLDGACSFKSSNNTHVNHRTAPITLGGNFSCAEAVLVWGQELTENLAFVAGSSSDPAKLDAQKGIFGPVAGSPYDGWQLEVDDAKLVWGSAEVVENATSKRKYQDLAVAIADASDNERLVLLSDCRQVGTLALDKSIVLDLSSHTLDIFMPASSLTEGENAAIALKEGGIDALVNGQISVTWQDGAALYSSTRILDGIQAPEGSALELTGVTFEMGLQGTLTGRLIPTMRGISSVDANVILRNQSALHVTVDTAQAIAADGIHMKGTGKDQVTIDASSKVTVQNDAHRQVQGSIACSGLSVSYQFANLMRFYPEEGSDVYKEIQEKFKRYAKADVPQDVAGKVYGAYVYYAAPLELDDGTYVWAYSEKVKPSEVGKEEVIKASVFFSQSHYDAVPDANAVRLAGTSAKATIAGSLSATSVNGSATGLVCDSEGNAKASGDVSVDAGARIDVSGSRDAYRAQGSEIDLKEILGIQDSRRIVYPQNDYKYSEVSWALPSTKAIGGSASSQVSMHGIVNINGGQNGVALDGSLVHPTLPAKVTSDKVSVTFDNIHGADGKLSDAQTRFQDFGTTIASGGGVPVGANYTAGGIEYRFVGWMQNSKVWQPSRVGELVLDQVNVPDDNAVTLYAAYVPVSPGMHLATFDVDERVAAYAVYDGESPDYCYANKSSTVSSVPVQQGVSYYLSSGFRGWKNLSTQMTYIATLPPAYGDVSYAAVFDQNKAKIAENCYAWIPVGNDYKYTYQIKRVRYGENGADELSKIVKAGDVVYTEGEVHSFLGWSARSSDKFAYYGLTPPAVTSEGLSVFAIYDTRDRIVPVSFYVDGKLYAQAARANTFLTVNGAFGLTKAEKPADKASNMRFRGWSLNPNGEPLLMGAVRTLATLTTAENPIKLYAVYGEYVDPDEAGEDEYIQKDEGGDSEKGKDSTDKKRPAATQGATGGSSGSGGSGSGVKVGGVPLGAMGIPVSLDPTMSALDADEALTGFDDSELAGSSQDLEDQFDTLMSLVTLTLIVGFLIAFVAWWIMSSKRNRKLDEEDDFYEPGAAGEEGERFVF